jgi:adenine-specific DNA-methyltransferase
MDKITPEPKKIAITSPDLREGRLAELRRLFPDLFDGEGKMDDNAVRALASPDGQTGSERFRFEWAGKQQSKRLAFTPSKATLIADPARSVDFDKTRNLIIEGENLEVLKLLQTTYFERVKCVYIDPPYNTGNDFIYPDDYSESKKAYWQRNGTVKDGVRLTALPESHGRRHSLWLNMMQPRLLLARQLPTDEGIIVVSVDDNEAANLRHLMDDVFGAGNFVAQISVQSNKRGQTYKEIAKTHEYLVVYAKSDDFEIFEFQKEEGGLPFTDKDGNYDLWELRNRNPKFNSTNRANLFFPIWVSPTIKDDDGFNRVSLEESADFSIKVRPMNSEDGESCWRWGKPKVCENIKGGIPTVVAKSKRDGGWNIYQKSRRDTTKAKSIWYETEFISEKGTVQLGDLGLAEYFDHPKPLGLLKKIIQLSCNDGDTIIDFFAGSGTLAHAAMEHCRDEKMAIRTILIQVPELIETGTAAYKAGYKAISDITIERVKRAGDSLRKQAPNAKTDTGFRVYRLADSYFPQNLFTPDPDKTEAENLAALGEHLKANRQGALFADEDFEALVTEIALKNGYGLFYSLEAQAAFTHNAVYRLKGNVPPAVSGTPD